MKPSMRHLLSLFALAACSSWAQAQIPAATAPGAPDNAQVVRQAQDARREAAASWNAYTLMQQCQDQANNVSQAQCIGAVRGIIHGYQYGMLFLAQHQQIDNRQVRPLALCLEGVPVNQLVQEFLADARQVDAETLGHTPAEVAVLGSVHQHHACR